MKIIGSERMIQFNNILKAENQLLSDFSDISELLLFSSGRGAIFHLFKNVFHKGKLLFPDFYCREMIKPIIAAGHKIDFYNVSKNLKCRLNRIKLSKDTNIIYLNDYAGFRDDELFDFARRKGLIIITDRTHSLFSKFKLKGDFEIASLRKCFPVPDGGILAGYGIGAINKKSEEPFFYDKLMSKHFRYIYETLSSDEHIEKQYLSLSAKSENKISCNAFPISYFSKQAVLHYDIESAVTARKRNFKYLLKNLPKNIKPAFDSLSSNIAPQSFPVFLKNRDFIKSNLYKDKIFLPILWLSDNPISEEILNIPVDEEYSIKDMERIISALIRNS